jgi:Flp pilus assembly protein TadD
MTLLQGLGAEIDRATELLRRGDPADAAAVLGAVLAREPGHAVAAHLLGLALKDTGDWAQGEEWLRFSIGLAPDRGEFHGNLANLLRRRGDYLGAEAAYRRALELLPHHRGARRGLAQTLNDQNRATEAVQQCRMLLGTDGADAEAWEILALALAQLERFEEAERAHRSAIALDPKDPVARHNLGALLTRLERPEALRTLEIAVELGAQGYEATYNRGQAALNAGDLEEAEACFSCATGMDVLNVAAQRALARIRFMRGDPAFARSLGAAVRAHPGNAPLQNLLAELLWRAGELPAAETLLRDVLTRERSNAVARSTLAMVLMEQARLEEAEVEALEAAGASCEDCAVVLNLVDVLIARGRPDEARLFIAAQRQRHPFAQVWLTYEATVARMLGEERYQELCDYERFVRIFDLEPPTGFASIAEFNQALATILNDRHRAIRQPLDQTVRNGTQAALSLLCDPEPVIRAALGAFQRAVGEYRGALGLGADHPLARAQAGEIHFTGAWSVRLQRHGFHVNHFHPEGVVSSAYYVEVPAEAQDQSLKSGWIKFGEPRYPIAGLGPERYVQPRPGRLVLFPSYMWHGTNPIYGASPRICIAFDMCPRPGGAAAPSDRRANP